MGGVESLYLVYEGGITGPRVESSNAVLILHLTNTVFTPALVNDGWGTVVSSLLATFWHEVWISVEGALAIRTSQHLGRIRNFGGGRGNLWNFADLIRWCRANLTWYENIWKQEYVRLKRSIEQYRLLRITVRRPQRRRNSGS